MKEDCTLSAFPLSGAGAICDPFPKHIGAKNVIAPQHEVKFINIAVVCKLLLLPAETSTRVTTAFEKTQKHFEGRCIVRFSSDNTSGETLFRKVYFPYKYLSSMNNDLNCLEDLDAKLGKEVSEEEVLELRSETLSNQTGVYSVSIRNVPYMLLNIFASMGARPTPKIDIIPFILPTYIPAYMGGFYYPEQFCIRCECRGLTRYYRLEWLHVEGPYGIRFSGPFEVWRSNYLDVDDLVTAERTFLKDTKNGWIMDIFNTKENPQRQAIDLIPVVQDQSRYILFQWTFRESTQYAIAEVLTDNKDWICGIQCQFGPLKEILKSKPSLKRYFQNHPELKPRS